MKYLMKVRYASKDGFKIANTNFVVYDTEDKTYINLHGVDLIENGFEILEEEAVYQLEAIE